MTANLAHPEPPTAQLSRGWEKDRTASMRLRVDLGVTMLFADQALAACGNDFDRAVEWIRARMKQR